MLDFTILDYLIIQTYNWNIQNLLQGFCMKPKFKVINPSTGEILDTVTLEKSHAKTEAFYMGYQNKELWLAKDKTVTKGEYRVFTLFKAVMDYKNEIDYTQTDISKELDMNITDVNLSVNSLVRRGVIEKVIHKGRYFTYRMNDEYAKKGNQIRRVK